MPEPCVVKRTHSLTLDERREESDVGGLPPARRQRHPDLVQLVPQHPAAVLRLCPERKSGPRYVQLIRKLSEGKVFVQSN